MPSSTDAELCPYARSTTAYRSIDREPMFVVNPCRKWTCKVCGPRKKAQLCKRIVHAKPQRMVTLTCRHELTPADQVQKMQRAAQRWWTIIRRTYGPQEYVRFTEECKDGFPHYHYLVRGTYLPQREIAEHWRQLTGAAVTDIRKAHGRSVAYVSKYVSKACTRDGTFSRQRLSVSRRFWVQEDRPNEMLGWEHDTHHPWEFVHTRYRDHTLWGVSRGLYHVVDREPGDGVPLELQPPSERP